MRKWVSRFLVLLFVVALIAPLGVQAGTLKPIIVRVQVREQLEWGDPRLPAPGVTACMIAGPWGIPVASCSTNSQGVCMLRGTVYDDERFVVWVRRTKPEGPWGLTIPIRYSQQIPADVGESWVLIADYTHNIARMIMGYILIY